MAAEHTPAVTTKLRAKPQYNKDAVVPPTAKTENGPAFNK
jgi:hypothetical protein